MSIRLFNTMTRRKEELVPIEPGRIRMYTCGPTVYNYAHIGNFRAYVFEDLLRRTLKYHGFEVTQVMNLTDVDDKTIRDSRAAGLPLNEFTAKFKQAFFEDLDKLGIEMAEYYPAATDHIPEMIELIRVLMDKGYAYQAPDGSVYYSIAKFADYGKLSKVDLSNQRDGVRISNDEYEKDAVADFALWKAWDEADGDVVWDSPWGRGRPGWHIECSAMSMKYLGKTFDLHTGGIDNMFPHHEDEIAQSEAANGCRFVNYWMHNNYLIVDGEKMSKSLGNFHTLRDLMDKGYSGMDIRLVLLGTHYRKKLNFTLDACDRARKTINKFTALFRKLRVIEGEGADAADEISRAESGFAAAIGDDLNFSAAMAAVFGLEKNLNCMLTAGELGAEGAEKALAAFQKFNSVLGVFDFAAADSAEPIPPEISALAEQRRQARANRDFAAADTLRDEIAAAGWSIIDSPDGPTLKRNG